MILEYCLKELNFGLPAASPTEFQAYEPAVILLRFLKSIKLHDFFQFSLINLRFLRTVTYVTKRRKFIFITF